MMMGSYHKEKLLLKEKMALEKQIVSFNGWLQFRSYTKMKQGELFLVTGPLVTLKEYYQSVEPEKNFTLIYWDPVVQSIVSWQSH